MSTDDALADGISLAYRSVVQSAFRDETGPLHEATLIEIHNAAGRAVTDWLVTHEGHEVVDWCFVNGLPAYGCGHDHDRHLAADARQDAGRTGRMLLIPLDDLA